MEFDQRTTLIGGDNQSPSMPSAAPAAALEPSAAKLVPSYRAFGTFRFLLALAVAMGHTRGVAPARLGGFFSVWEIGTICVMVFFILSGFVISEALNTFYRDRPAEFLANRLLRLVPPYLMALVLSVALHLLFVSTPPEAFSIKTLAHQLLLLIFSWGPAPPSYYFVRYIWAVSVELWFYVIYAAIFFTYLRRQKSDRGAFVLIGVAIICAYAARRSEITWIFQIWMAPYFLLGISFYWFVTKRSGAAATSILLCSAATVWHVFEWYGRTRYGVGAGLAVLALGVLVAVASQINFAGSVRKVDSVLGDLSYPLYLNHFAVQMVFMNLHPSQGWGSWLLFGLFACLLAAAANYLVEPRMKGLRNRLRGSAL